MCPSVRSAQQTAFDLRQSQPGSRLRIDYRCPIRALRVLEKGEILSSTSRHVNEIQFFAEVSQPPILITHPHYKNL
jgi:hypothetical protein